ncbi:Olfactory receptor 51I2 [Galemys pyrenaicus]|uniref:Olfactory receptor n=1 Tax=Galemys pyrenaicus TaxID=202257 RepID=A0A8J6DYP9_GALPY|nr:Olfactory receptor 51I2 [Galemys pyrenaicus]
MGLSDSSWFQPSTLLLTGTPGLEAVQIRFSLPLCVMYLIALLGNCTILFVIKTTPSLHGPQYILLSMLAATDVDLSLSTLPTVLNVFLLSHREIEFHSCLAQMFFIHTFSSIESAILLAMAFDRFVAIRNPLHYTVVLTLPRIIGMGIAAVVRGVMLMAPLPILLKRLSFCKGVILSHCYCYHPDVMKLACGAVRVNIIYGFSLVVCSFGVDFMFIVISYVLILKTVLAIASEDGQLKALNTCVSHIFTVLMFYVPVIVLALTHRFGTFTSPLLHVTMANPFLLLTPVLNPSVYGSKTKQIRYAAHKVFRGRANWLK